ERFRIRLAMAERPKKRKAERIGPHVEPASRNAEQRPEFGPQRLGVSHLPQVTADLAFPPGIVIAGWLIARAPLGQRFGDVLSGEHSRQNGVVAAFDARHVDEARRASDERSARERKLRY